jgi:Tol biopolymer transport system component
MSPVPTASSPVLPGGSGLQHLARGSYPSWSADGRLIAFTRSDGAAAQVWTMYADGTHERQVTDDADTAGTRRNPGFSPSGCRIVYTTASGYEEGSIFKVSPDGM